MKQHTIKRSLSLLLALALLFALIPQTALPVFAGDIDSGSFGENLTWEFNPETGELKITGNGDMRSIEYIDYPWHQYRNEITSVSLSEGLTSIGNAAFEACRNITSIAFPSTLETIGDNSFSSCVNLTSVNVPGNVTVIGSGAFAYCYSLSNLTLENGILEIGYEAFSGCSFSSVQIPESVQEIGDMAFSSGPVITVDPNNAFFCNDDEGALFDKEKKTILRYPTKSGSKEYCIPEGVEIIAHCAFSECYNLTSVIIPDTVTRIKHFAFSYCKSLKSVFIPANALLVGSPFVLCTALETIEVAAGNPYYCTDETGVLFNKGKTVLLLYPTARTDEYVIPYGVEAIDFPAFYYSNVTKLTIPETVPVLGSYALACCPKLNSVVIQGEIPWDCPGYQIDEPHPDDEDEYIYIPNDWGYAFRVCFEHQAGDIYYAGDCSEFDKYSLITGKARLHSFVTDIDTHWISTETAPTCTEPGVKESTCSCGYTKTEKIPAIGHSFENGVCVRCGMAEVTALFSDVPAGAYYSKAVLWAYQHEPQITDGIDDNLFGPDATCTRAQVVTFLWRANGCSAPASSNNPFRDVSKSSWFYEPVLWAYSHNPQVTDGLDNGVFGPNATCTRAQVVTFLWRAAGCPEPESNANPFEDVKTGDWYYKAVLWAVEQGVTDGVDDTHFAPAATCTRGQVVTFLYRNLG